jgi:dephospho-CoA kinase
MRELVFASPEARQQLEAIIHPMIGSVTKRRADTAEGCYLVFVVPLLVESGRWRDRVDRICVVDCDPATQIARVKARSGLTSDAIGRIISVQASREARLAVADDVILNDMHTSIEELEHRARELHLSWCRQAQQLQGGSQAVVPHH